MSAIRLFIITIVRCGCPITLLSSWPGHFCQCTVIPKFRKAHQAELSFRQTKPKNKLPNEQISRTKHETVYCSLYSRELINVNSTKQSSVKYQISKKPIIAEKINGKQNNLIKKLFNLKPTHLQKRIANIDTGF